ncbi:MAG TPA: 16S rRNA (uracil(1498)-N(3))-methyltransferase, partial [Gammaproteobacteria bacterium]|nr:16S rRNA (uracil(1498)-N(3))-methyltransferase [Gammaproteobacteria bacterium]
MPRPEKAPKRLYVDASLASGSLVLEADQAHYLGRVLRCREGDRIVVFNARGVERSAAIESLAKRRPVLALGAAVEQLPEPAVQVLLLQALVKSDAMDLIVQKATELGVSAILATRTDFSVVKLDGEERRQRRLAHWRRIAENACEQCGRHRPPDFSLLDSLQAACEALPADCTRIAFDTRATAPLNGAARAETQTGLCLAIGPEGGFSPPEIELLDDEDFLSLSLGPRTLRAETAAIAAVAGT